MNTSGLPSFLSAASAARACGVAEYTIRRWVSAGYLAADTSGPTLRVPSAELRPWLTSRVGLDGQARLGQAGPNPGQVVRNGHSTTVTDTETAGPGPTALVDPVATLNAELVAQAEAAAMGQARADLLAGQLGAARIQLTAPPGQAGDVADDVSIPGTPRPWWRRWAWWRWQL
jgi:hypothetical protein